MVLCKDPRLSTRRLRLRDCLTAMGLDLFNQVYLHFESAISIFLILSAYNRLRIADRRRHVCDFPPPWLGDDLFSGVERRSDLLDWTTLGETMPLYALLGQLHFDHVEYLTTNDVSTRP